MSVFKFVYHNGWPVACSPAQYEAMCRVAEQEKLASPVIVEPELSGAANLISANGKHIWVEPTGFTHEI